MHGENRTHIEKKRERIGGQILITKRAEQSGKERESWVFRIFLGLGAQNRKERGRKKRVGMHWMERRIFLREKCYFLPFFAIVHVSHIFCAKQLTFVYSALLCQHFLPLFCAEKEKIK